MRLPSQDQGSEVGESPSAGFGHNEATMLSIGPDTSRYKGLSEVFTPV